MSIRSDQPKSRTKDDRFGRSRFAEDIASDLRNWKGDESLVVGLCGSWGAGKTTLCNFIREKLNARRQKKNHMTVIDFNPWQLSGHVSLTQTFFSELQTLFRPAEQVKIRRLSSRLGGIGSLLTASGKVVQLAGKGADFFAPGTSLVTDQISKVASETGEAVRDVKKLAERDEMASHQSLAEIKSEVVEMMESLTKPVVVVIDDIDRLTSEEIREIFQLVRVNADFPNLIFLMLFDRDIVAQALNPIAGNRGDEFLEKIVPMLHEVPAVRPKILREILGKGLAPILRKYGAEKMWLPSRFHEVWTHGIDHYFRTPRDIERFLNGYRIYLKSLSIGGRIELDPVDMFFVETLRIFDPEFYAEIEKSENFLLSGRYGSAFLQEREREKAQESRLQEIAACSRQEQRGLVSELLKAQFPALAKYPSINEEERRRRKRLCHELYFRSYFSRDRTDEEIRVSDIENMISYLKGEGSVTFIEACNRRNLVSDLFDECCVHLNNTEYDDIGRAISRLAELCDKVSSHRTEENWLSWPPLSHAKYLVRAFLGKLPEEDRFSVLMDAYRSTPAFALSLTHAWSHLNPGSEDFHGKNAWHLMLFAREKVALAAEEDRITHLQNWSDVCYAWRACGGVLEINDWLEKKTADGPAIIKVLPHFLGLSTQGGGGSYRKTHSLPPETMSLFFDVQRLQEATRGIQKNDLDDREKKALKSLHLLQEVEENKWGYPEGSRNQLSEEY